jgi:hypothetical protein
VEHEVNRYSCLPAVTEGFCNCYGTADTHLLFTSEFVTTIFFSFKKNYFF